MFKKKIIFLLLLLLSSCGYEAIHSKKNLVKYNFSISNLELIGDRNINLKVKEKLNNYMIIDERDKIFTLKISSTSERLITAKNIAGDATSFQNTIVLNVEVSMNNNFKEKYFEKMDISN